MMADEGGATSKGSGINWLLWWRIDRDELERQVAEYRSLKLWQSARGVAVLCLALSIALTTGLAVFGVAGFDAWSLVDAGLMAALAVFIGHGQGWAMIAAMVLWTLEKAFMIVIGLQSQTLGSPVFQLLWWCAYMHAFYFAFRVEHRRRKLGSSARVESGAAAP